MTLGTGREIAAFAPRDDREHLAERVEPFSSLKYPSLKALGRLNAINGGIHQAQLQFEVGVN